MDALLLVESSCQAYGTAVHEGQNVIKYGPGGAKVDCEDDFPTGKMPFWDVLGFSGRDV